MKPSRETIRRRIQVYGWSEDEARNTPVMGRSQASSYALKRRKTRHPWKRAYKPEAQK